MTFLNAMDINDSAALDEVRPPVRPRVAPIIDVEASGFGAGSYPIEIGCVLRDGRRLCTLIKPEPDWTHWDPKAQAMHGLTRSMIERAGRPIGDVCDWLNREIGPITVYSDAWHNDWGWINRLYDAAGRVPRMRVESLRAILMEDELAGWHDTVSRVRMRQRRRRHRAATDAATLQVAYVETLASTAVELLRQRMAISEG
jgi:hypothetical protein